MRKPNRAAWATAAVVLVLLIWLLIRTDSSLRSVPSPSPSPAATALTTPLSSLAPMLSPAASPSPAATPSPNVSPSPAPRAAGPFELPIMGATGYTSAPLKLYAKPDAASEVLETLSAGTPFRIESETGLWWHVTVGKASGWLPHRYCLINLPDVIPSIVYDATNTYASLVVSSGKALPGITGEGLYPGTAWNGRLGRKQFIMPVLYAMAKKVAAAQRSALKSGEALVLYEAYRPYDVQMTIVRALTKLASGDVAVMNGISASPWSLSWFASTRLSNHQRGCAIDVSLAKVTKSEQARSGDYAYTRVTSARRYQMPTPIHELSQASAAFVGPVDSKSRTAWKSAKPSVAMNAAALRLQGYCASAGLTPLASEWWHFNDLDSVEATADTPSTGRYTLKALLSTAP